MRQTKMSTKSPCLPGSLNLESGESFVEISVQYKCSETDPLSALETLSSRNNQSLLPLTGGGRRRRRRRKKEEERRRGKSHFHILTSGEENLYFWWMKQQL